MKAQEKILKGILAENHNWYSVKKQLEKYNTDNEETGEKDRSVGKLFEVFTKLYFQTHPEVKNQYKNVWYYDEIPMNVKKKCGWEKFRNEAGADLLLEDFDGKLISVQCKFSNDQTKIFNWSADKISNMYSFGMHTDGYILFCNGSDTDIYTKYIDEKNFQLYTYHDFVNTPDSVFQQMYNDLCGKTKKVKKKTPKEHQAETIDALIDYKSKTDKDAGRVVLPCGAGKSLLSLWGKEALQAKELLSADTTLVLVPSLALLRQIKTTWAFDATDPYIYKCVCSDKDIDKKNDDVEVKMYEMGHGVTTNPAEIARFLDRSENKVIFSTYQSLHAVVEAQDITNKKIDLVICDEAHRTTGSAKKNFTLINDREAVKADFRLYMTATQRTISDSVLSRYSDTTFYSMDDASVYGDVIYQMSFGEAIKRGILVDYQIIAVGVDDDELSELTKERRFTDIGASADEVAAHIALNKVMKKNNAKHALSFHSRVASAEAFAERHEELFPETIGYSVSGKQSIKVREDLLDEFSNADNAVMSNARCLTEGVDVPNIDVVLFVDNKNSTTDVVQAAGRGLRLAEGKKMSYIVVPVFHTKSEDVNKSVDKSVFKRLVSVVRAMAEQDEEIWEIINFIASGKGKAKTRKAGGGRFDSRDIIQMEGFTEAIKDSLFTEVIDKSCDSWETSFLQLKELGKLPKTSQKHLFVWVENQRQRYKGGVLLKYRIEKLESLPFWFWYLHNELWEKKYKEVESFYKKHGRLPKRGEKNGIWLIRQRKSYKKRTLSDYRVEKLEVFPDWSWDPKKDAFYEKFEDLKNFIKIHGRFPINEENKFVCRMRYSYKKGMLEQYKIDALNKINFIWDGRAEIRMQKFKDTIETIDRIIEKGEQVTNAKVGSFLKVLKSYHKQGTLLPHEEEALKKRGLI